jgi:hypothetical protein
MAVAAVYIMYLRVPPYFCVGAGAVVVGSGSAVVEGVGEVVVAGAEVVGVDVGVDVGVVVRAGSPQLTAVITTSRITRGISNFLIPLILLMLYPVLKGVSLSL